MSTRPRLQRGFTRVEEYKHPKYGQPVEIILERDSGKFSATIDSKCFENSDLTALRKSLQEHIEKTVKMNWVGVIKVVVNGEGADESSDTERGNSSAELEIAFERFWLAKVENEWFKCDVWHSEEYEGSDHYVPNGPRSGFYAPVPRRLNSRKWGAPKEDFKIPYSYERWEFNEKGSEHYIEYTPELWAALCAICGKIGQLKKGFAGLIASPKGRHFLMERSGHLLTFDTEQA
jgi:hypothetical protein